MQDRSLQNAKRLIIHWVWYSFCSIFNLDCCGVEIKALSKASYTEVYKLLNNKVSMFDDSEVAINMVSIYLFQIVYRSTHNYSLRKPICFPCIFHAICFYVYTQSIYYLPSNCLEWWLQNAIHRANRSCHMLVSSFRLQVANETLSHSFYEYGTNQYRN